MAKYFSGSEIEAIDPNPFLDPVHLKGVDPKYDETEDEVTLSQKSSTLPPEPVRDGQFSDNLYAARTTAGFTQMKYVTFYRRGIGVITGYQYGTPLRT